MDLNETLAVLDSLGTEQNRKIYSRHGVKGSAYGVSFANMDKLVKQIKKDKSNNRTDLAKQLWVSNNHDARILATKIADPLELDQSVYETWVLDLDNYVITDAFSNLASLSPYAVDLMQAWIDSPLEWISAAGWNILSNLAIHDSNLSNEFFIPYLDEIQEQIHHRPNRTRHSMNNALISIGVRNKQLETQALDVAKVVGKVSVDHGQTGCKTPLAPEYIQKTWDFRLKKGK